MSTPLGSSTSPPKLSALPALDTAQASSTGNAPVVSRLASHLIAAKRSLTAATLVQRADTLVLTARKNVEDIAALSARNAYLEQFAQGELRVLQKIRSKLDDIRTRSSGEFKTVLRQLDVSGDRVDKTLHLLKTTFVEPSFRTGLPGPLAAATDSLPSRELSPKSSVSDVDHQNPAEHLHTPSTIQEPQPKCLYDFVSEQSVDHLTRIFRECIDATNDATTEFSSSIEEFDTSLLAIAKLLKSPSSQSVSIATLHADGSGQKFHDTTPAKRPASQPQNDATHDGSNRTLGDDNESSTKRMPSLFRSLESHATEIAALLQSLVRHYDLCVTALKYTEGGGEAVAEAQAKAQIDMPSGIEQLADRDTPQEPASEEDLAEIIEVLDKDALEVDDVVQDIRDHAAEMEIELEVISSEAKKSRTDYARFRKAIQYLEALGHELTTYVSASSTFLDKWAAQKDRIAEKLQELESIRDFYEGFLGAYDDLVLEIGRRKLMQTKMEKILSEAMAKVSKLHAEDAEQRETFKAQQGEFLPIDLWPGLVDDPPKFEIQRVDAGASSLPEISKAAVQRAMQRLGKRI